MSEVAIKYRSAQVDGTAVPGDEIGAEASKKLQELLSKGDMSSILSDPNIVKFLDNMNDPSDFDGPDKGWGSKNPEDLKRVILASFYGENYNIGSVAWRDPRGSNATTALVFAMMGLKIFDNNPSKWTRNGVDDDQLVDVFQIIKDKLSGLDDPNGPLQNPSSLSSVEEQEKALLFRKKAEPTYQFASEMCDKKAAMIAYCNEAGLGDDDNPCYNITRQWEADNDARGPDKFIPAHDVYDPNTGELHHFDDKWEQGDYLYRADRTGAIESGLSQAERDARRASAIKYDPHLDAGDILKFFQILSS